MKVVRDHKVRYLTCINDLVSEVSVESAFLIVQPVSIQVGDQ